MIYMSCDVSPCKEVLFGGRIDTAPHFCVKYPTETILRAQIRILRPNLQNVKTCILSKLLHRLQPDFSQ